MLYPQGSVYPQQGSFYPQGALGPQAFLNPQGGFNPQGSVNPQGSFYPQGSFGPQAFQSSPFQSNLGNIPFANTPYGYPQQTPNFAQSVPQFSNWQHPAQQQAAQQQAALQQHAMQQLLAHQVAAQQLATQQPSATNAFAGSPTGSPNGVGQSIGGWTQQQANPEQINPALTSRHVGCAPGAEVHIFKVVPGGNYSDLIDALDQCIERRLDIVQIGVSGEQFSELVAQKITEARLNGIACVAGAGNSGGAVQFPGNVPGVMTVSAVGKLGEYPQVDPNRVGAGLPDLQQVPGLLPSNQQFFGSGIGAGAHLGGTLQAPFTHPAAYLGDPMNAILQLRAAGLWV